MDDAAELAAQSPQPNGAAGRSRAFLPSFLNPILVALLLALAGVLPAPAALRFDMFVGYDGIVPQGSWFPVAFEIHNDGPGFMAQLEVTPGSFNSGQKRTMFVELPTGTTKRFVLPVYNAATYNSSWDARLLDEKERVRAEVKGQRVRRQHEVGVPLPGAFSRTPPPLPEIKGRNSEMQPVFARLQPQVFPDNPIALEGLHTIYLASERALELSVPQVGALLAWLHSGGHLVVSVEQPNHLTGPGEWLGRLLPAEVTGMTSINGGPSLHEWVTGSRRFDGREYSFTGTRRTGGPKTEVVSFTNPFTRLTNDTAFTEPLQATRLKLRDGRALLSSSTDAAPIIVVGRRGRGQITQLAFAPELEPFKSWHNAPWFWAKMADYPLDQLTEDKSHQRYAGRSVDAVFGAMVDSDQIRKLPVGWLLLLLVAYLAVIGPLDQYWLKKLNKQMLTWITFPLYVAFFSALIYFIGYKLRAGESEWNELHVIDVMPHSGQAGLRGRTFASIYSPVNARYKVASELPFATLRGESMGNMGGGQESSRANVRQVNNAFEGELAVPVWTSQLFVSDWWSQGPPPLAVTISAGSVIVENHLDTLLVSARLVINGDVLDLGDVPAKQSKTFNRGVATGRSIQSFVNQHGSGFMNVSGSRQRAFGDNTWSRLPDRTNCAMAASFVTRLNNSNQDYSYNHWNPPPRFDLNDLVQRGDAILLAYAPGFAPVKPLNKFTARRGHRSTLFRVAVEMKNSP